MKKMFVFVSFALLLALSFFSCRKNSRAPTDSTEDTFLEDARNLASTFSTQKDIYLLVPHNVRLVAGNTVKYIGVTADDDDDTNFYVLLNIDNKVYRSEGFNRSFMGSGRIRIFAGISNNNWTLCFALDKYGSEITFTLIDSVERTTQSKMAVVGKGNSTTLVTRNRSETGIDFAFNPKGF
jgi:hypothetical protein